MDNLLKIKKDYIQKILENNNEEIINKIFKMCVNLDEKEIKEQDLTTIKHYPYYEGKPYWYVDYKNLPIYRDSTGTGVEYLKYTITC